MINVCVIGLGNWGKKVLNSIKKIKKIISIQIVKNRRDRTKVNLNNLNWVFVTTVFFQLMNICCWSYRK